MSTTKDILGQAKNVRQLLDQKYAVDYYQREYKWETKQIQELLDDLTGKFLDEYREEHSRAEVARFDRYFLGSIIISRKNDANYIVDGQQRLTTLTLLLIFLRNQQQDRPDKVKIDDLIFSERYGIKSFNLDVPRRLEAMEALFSERAYDDTGKEESIRTIIGRYQDIEEHFPSELRDRALPYFIDWLVENVYLVEITAFSDEAAYTIFETMNDRGLSLTPTDMLKGFLLAKITDEDKKNLANELWRRRTQELRDISRDVEPDFFKSWLRSQYAQRIRERRKGARPEDFDRIGTEYHRWVRDHASDRDDDDLSLVSSDEFAEFINRDFDFYSRHYKRFVIASRSLTSGLEHIYYNARLGFTLQLLLLLAPLQPGDSDFVVDQKARASALYLDILLAWRIWNYRSISYSTMQYAMFLVMRSIRRQSHESLVEILHASLVDETETITSNDHLGMHQQNRVQLRHLLARMTDFIEVESGRSSRYEDYEADTGRNRYEVEHIWADKPEEHDTEFENARDFRYYRNRIGGLLLLPKSFNASYGAKPYSTKVGHYYGQNLLAQSLNTQAYSLDPGFRSFINRTGLPFQPHEEFLKRDIDARQALYSSLAQLIWHPDRLLAER